MRHRLPLGIGRHHFFAFTSRSIALGQQLLQLRVLGFQCPQLLRIRRFHPAILALVFVEGTLADPIAPAHVSRLLASFLFLDHLNDLFVGEHRLHLSALWLGGLYTKLEEMQGLRSS